MNLSILSPERRLVESVAIESVTLPTGEGQVQLLPGHAPMVGVIETGVFSYKPVSGVESNGIFTTGFFEVRGEEVVVMAETLELHSEINLDRARKAQKVSEDALKDMGLDEHKFKKYQLKLQRALVRQQLATKDH